MKHSMQVDKHLPSIYKCKVCKSYVEEEVHCNERCILILDGMRRLRLSKLMSALLRHIPHEVGLSMDKEGWVSIGELVNAIRTKWRNRAFYSWLKEEHVIAVALLDKKGRFELKEGKIRAKYGHSIHISISLPEDKEVKILYHGTQVRNLRKILKEGIKPMRRIMVHLTLDKKDALENARRKGSHVAIIAIDADKLRQMGHTVYKAGYKVYVTDYVPPSCICDIRVVKGS